MRLLTFLFFPSFFRTILVYQKQVNPLQKIFKSKLKPVPLVGPRVGECAVGQYPTEPFTILEPQNTGIGEFHLVQKR